MDKVIIEIDEDLKDLVPQFIENRKKDIVTLQNLVANNEFDSIAQLSHKIKGAAAGYGFKNLSDLAAKMEVAAKENNHQTANQLAQDIENHFSNIEVRYITMS